jgi:hypothetical protein
MTGDRLALATRTKRARRTSRRTQCGATILAGQSIAKIRRRA